MQKKTDWQVGTAKVEITAFVMHCGMLGYGRHFHYLEGQETPQYARAYYFVKGDRRLAFINAELCFCTDYLKLAIVDYLAEHHPELGLQDDNLMITAQHTHSTAGGYNQYLLYNVTTPGFNQETFEIYLKGLVKVLVEAAAQLKPVELFYRQGAFDPEAPVCFNRSVGAYNANPENQGKGKISARRRHLACDREMKLLGFCEPETGRVLHSLNWFGVHTTSVSNRVRKICYDNKGYAAEYLEDEHWEKGVHAFAQDACGDVSPNYVWRAKHRVYSGPYTDDYENAAFNGRLQADQAKQLIAHIHERGERIEGDLDYIQAYFDMSQVHIAPQYAQGLQGAKTTGAAIGMSFLEGTTDGQGAPKAVGAVIKALFEPIKRVELLLARRKGDEGYRRLVDFYFNQRPKTVVMNASAGMVLGSSTPDKLILPDFVDPVVKYLKRVYKIGQGVSAPWVPERLPLQIFLIGPLALVGIPAEITTTAAQRLRETLAPVLAERGVKFIQLCPYANSYAGYITTREEYRTQHYEGGHTLFGQWTLAAYQMQFENLAKALLLPPKERQKLGVAPTRFQREEIWQGFVDEKVRVW